MDRKLKSDIFLNEISNWCQLENSLAHLDFSEFLDDWWHEDEDDDNYMRDHMFLCEDNANYICTAIMHLDKYFSEWITSVDMKNVKQNIKFKELLNEDTDIFFTFNYTSTLQDIYNCRNITHIHGKVGEKLLLGHGNDNFDEEYYEQNYFGSQNIIYELYTVLRKNTQKAIIENRNFFNSLDDIDKIYSFGFSFSDVDLIYIEEICKNIKSDVTWYLNSFDGTDKMKKFEAIIKKCGFKGNISSYEI